MRLIDADAFKENMFKYAAPEMVWDMADIVHKIDEMPTIEPERKKGKWIEMESAPGRCYYATCSKCMVTMTIEQDYHNFCPNCGADMREQP